MRMMMLAAAAVVAGPALADDGRSQVCLDRQTMVKRLTERFGEQQLAMGLADKGGMEIYASGDTGTWTVVISLPDGRSCLLAAGGMWQPVEPEPEGDPL